jgi:hypothetical protein
MVSIQFSHTSLSKCKCSSPFRNLMSCSLLTPWLCSLCCVSFSDVIYGIFCLCCLSCLSCGNVTYGTVIGYLIALTIVGTANGSILPLIIFYALKFVLSCSLFTPKTKAPPSWTLFFLLRAFIGEFATTFFLFSNVVYISSLVLLTLANGFYGFSFWCIN